MSAPSFSTFPPSFSSFPDLGAGGESSKREENEEKSRKSSKREHSHRKEREREKDKERRGEKERRKDKDKHRSRHESRGHSEHGSKRDVDIDTEDSHRFFFSDRRGDPLNIQYGGLHAGDVPRYRLIGGGRQILGLPNSLTAYQRTGKGIEIGVRTRWKVSGLTDSGSRSLLNAPPTRRILNSDVSTKYEEVDGFIRLPTRRSRQNPEDSYRAITNDNNNSDSEHSSDNDREDDDDSSDDESGSILTSLQETLKSLEQELASEPSAVDKWLLLLTHTLSTIPITSKNATKVRSEISVSILSRALSAHPLNSASKQLRLKYLKSGEEIWHESKLRAEWEAALKVGGVEIWMEWLEWRTRVGNDGMEGVVRDATRAIEAFGRDEEGEIAKLRVFWRIAVAFQNAGFLERAMAMFQAQAELFFKMPPALHNAPKEQVLDELEEFWEAEVPRVGEEGAMGWGHWYSLGKPEAQIPTTGKTPSKVVDLDPYRQWAAEEAEADRRCYMPTRSTDEQAESDPYSTVLFADIRALMLILASPRAKQVFRVAWLSVLGLEVPGFASSLSSVRDLNWDDRWNKGYVIRPSYLNVIFPGSSTKVPLLTDSVAGTIIGREKEYENSFGPIKSWGMGVMGPLEVGPGGEKGIWNRNDLGSVDEALVRRVFGQLRSGNEDDEWDTLSLAFEAAVGAKGAVRRSKELLATARESLSHWKAHADLERIRGKLDEARKVYQAVLIASKPDRQQAWIAQLWWSWAEMEWLAGQREKTMNVVLRSVGLEGRGGVVVLRGKRMLEDAIGAERRWKEREGWIKLRALLEVLVSEDIESGLLVMDRYLSEDVGGVGHESLTVASLLLGYHYGQTLKNAMRRSIVRERVERALEEYPSNSVILGMFLEGEKGEGVWGRVRGMLGGEGGKKDVARRVEEVWLAGWEKGRWMGEVERTRNGLAAAVEVERTRASSIVWRLYIEFELRAGAYDRAKKLLFRAVGECPLVKELYLLAFGPLRGVFRGDELRGLGDTMAERGMRLRKGLEEVLEGWGGSETDSGESTGEDEIESRARELRRLMPY